MREIFLFNFEEDAKEKDVFDHFLARGVSVKNVRYRCHPDSDIKRFVMKIRNEGDFMKVVYALPDYTGCRWYDPENRPEQNGRKRGFFNNGRFISGPDFYVNLADLSSQSTPATPQAGILTGSPVVSDSAMEVNTDREAPPTAVSSVPVTGSTATAARDSNVKDMIKPLSDTSSATVDEVNPVVPVQNRFNVLQSPKLKVGVDPSALHQEVCDTVVISENN